MFEPQRQHPVAAISNVLSILKEHILKIILVYLVGGQQSQTLFFSFTGLGILVGVLLLWGILSWIRYTYRVEEDELRIEYGVFVRKKLFIPRNRIQVIDITSGVLQRMFGLVSVKVKTAGQTAKEANISAIEQKEAEQLRELLRIKDKDREAAESTEIQHPSRGLSKKALLVAALTSGHLGVALSIIGTALSQLNDVISDTVIYRHISAWFDSLTGFTLVLMGILIISSAILAFLGTLIRYANFRVIRKEDELQLERGFFEKKVLTIPINRIQAIRIEEGILRQPLGFAALYIDSAGYGDEESKSTVFYPLIKRTNIKAFVKEFIPEFYSHTTASTPPVKALRRYMVKGSVPVLILAALLYLTPVAWYWSLIVLPLGLFWGWLRYRDAALGVTGNTLLVRERRLGRTTALIPGNRIQAAISEQNWFQERQGLEDIELTIASGRGGASFSVWDMNLDWGRFIKQWVIGTDRHKLTAKHLNSGRRVILPAWH